MGWSDVNLHNSFCFSSLWTLTRNERLSLNMFGFSEQQLLQHWCPHHRGAHPHNTQCQTSSSHENKLIPEAEVFPAKTAVSPTQARNKCYMIRSPLTGKMFEFWFPLPSCRDTNAVCIDGPDDIYGSVWDGDGDEVWGLADWWRDSHADKHFQFC